MRWVFTVIVSCVWPAPWKQSEEWPQQSRRHCACLLPEAALNSARVDGLQSEKFYTDIIKDQLAAKK